MQPLKTHATLWFGGPAFHRVALWIRVTPRIAYGGHEPYRWTICLCLVII